MLARGKRYARAANDPFLAAALELFIREEQLHSAYLAAFMESQGIPRAPRYWVDTAFRRLRGLAGLELSLTVLVTAEIIAMAYYRALREATGSPTLKTICRRILEDKSAHLRFQASMLGRIAPRSRRAPALQTLITKAHHEFLQGTIALVWMEHRNVFHAAGYDFHRFRKETLFEFTEWESSRRAIANANRSRKEHNGNLHTVRPLGTE